MPRPEIRSQRPGRSRTGRILPLRGGVALLRAGHPWVFRDKDVRNLGAPPAGTVIRVVDARDGSFVASGLFDPTSTIAVRLLSRDPAERVGRELIIRRLHQAIDERAPLLARGETTAWRLVNTEGDGLGGLAVDLYGEWAVIKPYTPIWSDHLPSIASELMTRLSLQGVMLQSFIRKRGSEAGPAAAALISGREMPPDLTVRENGRTFLAAVGKKRKTGIFLDARDSRRALAALCEGARVLNLFSYTSAYSIYAALAGAVATVNVDLARPCVGWSEHNFRLNDLDPNNHEFVCADAFEYLARTPGEPFDVVILDPPSFATSKRHVMTARRGYRRLIGAACQHVRPGGILVCSSNTARVAAEDFIALAGKAAAERGRSYRLHEVHGLPRDFPTLPMLPESRYLKCLIGVLD